MKLNERGQPPYRVSSGFIPKIESGPEHWANAATFLQAIKIIFDLTDGGKDLYGARVVDSKNQTVFTTNEAADVSLLRQMDLEGLNNVEVI